MLSGDYNSGVEGPILEITKKRLNDCSAQVEQYCVEMAKPVRDMAIQ